MNKFFNQDTDRMRAFSFEKLLVWQHASDFVVYAYKLLRNFPKFEMYGLCDQIRRSSSSIPANIAEGTGRTTGKDQARFMGYAYSSLIETVNHFINAKKLGYITEEELSGVRSLTVIIAKQSSALRKSRLGRKNNRQSARTGSPLRRYSTLPAA